MNFSLLQNIFIKFFPPFIMNNEIHKLNDPKLNSPPNLAGNTMIRGKNVNAINMKHKPRPKNIAKFFQFIAAYYTSCTFVTTFYGFRNLKD